VKINRHDVALDDFHVRLLGKIHAQLGRQYPIDFNRDQPTRAQLDCCEELIRYLRQRCGKVGDHYPIVKPHREVNPPRWATDCPGDVFPYSWFRRFQE